MTQINLFPWREEKNKRLKKQFLISLILIIVILITLFFILSCYKNSKINFQIKINKEIQIQTGKQKEKNKTLIEKVEEKKDQLNSIQFFNKLKSNEEHLSDLINNLPKIIPSNCYLLHLLINNNKIFIVGIMPVENSVLELINHINKSEKKINVSLNEVKSILIQNLPKKEFKLTIIPATHAMPVAMENKVRDG